MASHPVLGAGIGGALGALVGSIAGVMLGTHSGDSKESWDRAITAWKAKHPEFKKAGDEEVILAMDSSNAAIAGVSATIGTFMGALIGAWVGSPSTSSTATGTAGVPRGFGVVAQPQQQQQWAAPNFRR